MKEKDILLETLFNHIYIIIQVIRRTSKEEKFLVLYRYHLGHTCNESYTVVSIVYWDALEEKKSLHIYQKLTELLPPYGLPTQRKCEFNIKCVNCHFIYKLDSFFPCTYSKTCACQGYRDVGGASYSFGCSWSVYYNGCKFARSKIPRKFRLQVPEKVCEYIPSPATYSAVV